jgi:hypothetical protein
MNEGTVPGIKVSWSETTRFAAFLDMDQARQVFGLGGTPDDQVMRKARLIVTGALVNAATNAVLQDNAEAEDGFASAVTVNSAQVVTTPRTRYAEAPCKPEPGPGLYWNPRTQRYEAPAGPKSYTGREIKAAWERATQAIEDGTACGPTITVLLHELGRS